VEGKDPVTAAEDQLAIQGNQKLDIRGIPMPSNLENSAATNSKQLTGVKSAAALEVGLKKDDSAGASALDSARKELANASGMNANGGAPGGSGGVNRNARPIPAGRNSQMVLDNGEPVGTPDGLKFESGGWMDRIGQWHLYWNDDNLHKNLDYVIGIILPAVFYLMIFAFTISCYQYAYVIKPADYPEHIKRLARSQRFWVRKEILILSN
jgi:hypothetical protein